MQAKARPTLVDPGSITGTDLAATLAARYPREDWLAALAKGAVMSRGDVARILHAEGPLPAVIVHAALDLEALLATPERTRGDDVFAARTNADDAMMEVDGEAGLQTVPSPKPHPSRSNSPHEQGVREGDRESNDT